MPNQHKPTHVSTAHLVFVTSLNIFLAPKEEMEVHAREYHSWGRPHTKILESLHKHFDTAKYGLGYVLWVTFWVIF